MEFKGRKDFTEELKIAVPESIKLANEKGLEDAITYLYGFEKKARLAGDFSSLKEVCVHLVSLCREK